jgi:tRNA C32,U32 (ribose-2'-O)-methylase TrmJ
MSLNLAHAVTVVLHDLTRDEIRSGPWSHPHAGPASTLEESEAALEEFIEALDRTGYLGKSGKESVRREKIGVLWRRLRPTRREIDFIRGALQALAGIPSRRVLENKAKAARDAARETLQEKTRT